MLEKEIEAEVREILKQANGHLLKWVCPGNKGVPDRIVLLNRRISFFEFKKKGEAPTPLQYFWLDLLTRLGFKAGWADSLEATLAFINEHHDSYLRRKSTP